MSIGHNIRARREALGKPQAWLAEKAGCLQSQISEWERDVGLPPRIDAVVAIAKALRVSVATLTKDDAALADTIPPTSGAA